MVCLGNICRSPLAEGIMKHKIEQNGLHWVVDSAATANWNVGHRPDERSIAVAKKQGIDLSKQSARHLTKQDLDIFDLIFAMDANNYNDIRALATTNEQLAKVHLIRNMVAPARNLQVPDPYYAKSITAFQEVFDMLEECCDAIINKYNKNNI